jgi:hypothetical protein
VKSGQNKGKNKCKHTKRFKTQHPAARPGLTGALGSLGKGGEEEQGGSEGLLEALHAGKGAGAGKKNAGEAKVGWSLSWTASRRLER